MRAGGGSGGQLKVFVLPVVLGYINQLKDLTNQNTKS